MELPADLDRALGPRDVVTVVGPDAESYLHSQVSQVVTGMAVGEQRWTFVLDPSGKIVALARITRADDATFELDTDAGAGDGLAERLRRFMIRVDASVELTPATDDPEAASRDEAEGLRVEIGWPKIGAEIVVGETLVAGTGLAAVAVSFTKGCYPGQELVERMDSRGADAPRSLRRVTVGDDTQPGDPLVVDGDEVGTVTSVAGGRALAWVRRGADVGEPLQFT